MADGFALSVLTPQREVFSGTVATATVSGFEGDFGVLPGHVAYITAVRPGVLSFTAGGERRLYAVGDGFAQVAADRVSIVVSSCEDASSIDLDATKLLLASAEKALLDADPGEAAYVQAQADMALALGRLQAAGRGGE